MIHAHSAHAEGSAQHPAPIAASSSTAALAQTTGIPLSAIAYVSTAITPLMVPTLELLHQRAVDHNRRHGITGVLLYNAGNFMQYLEGPQPEVARLYARIEADARHKHVVQLLSGPIVQRSFAQWHMGLVQATASDVLALSTASWQQLHDAPQIGPAASPGLTLLLDFWRQESA